MKTYTTAELKDILNKHALWMRGDPSGVRANLSDANLYGADLRGANLSDANLSDANLYGADLRGANLSDAKNLNYPIVCPEEGSFIAFKKACNMNRTKCYIIKLEIPSDAMRCSATSRKCRCSKAKVISITNIDGTEANVNVAYSQYDRKFEYQVGGIVKVDNFDTDRWHECAPGIHFFITRKEAVDY